MAALTNIDYIVVSIEDHFSVCTLIDSSPLVGLDIETDPEGRIVFIQVYVPESGTTYIWDVREEWTSCLGKDWSRWHVVCHYGWFDFKKILDHFGTTPVLSGDTFYLACSLQEEEKSLKSLINTYFGKDFPEWEVVFDGNDNYEVMGEEHWRYIANDPYFCYSLYKHYESTRKLWFVEEGHRIDLDAFPRYLQAGVRGIGVNLDDFGTLKKEQESIADSFQARLDEYAGWDVNVNSPKKMRELLYEQMELPAPPVTTGKGLPSTSKEALAYLEDKDGILTVISELKQARRFLSTASKLPGWVEGGRMSVDYRLVGFDATSRVYSSDPSLSQFSRIFRKAFVPAAGNKFLYVDWKAAELLVAAQLSGCSELILAYESDDMYVEIAKRLFDVEEVDSSLREKTKVVILSVLFGSEGETASRRLHIPLEEGEELVRKVFSSYPELESYRREVIGLFKSSGFVCTYFGRPRSFKPDAEDPVSVHRKVVNTVVQGTCADCSKKAVASLTDDDPVLVTTVFDSFLFEVPLDYTEEDADEFCDRISGCTKFKFRYNRSFGMTWAECQDRLGEEISE